MAAETCATRKSVLFKAESLLKDLIEINNSAEDQEIDLINAEIDDADVASSIQLILDSAGTATTGIQARLIALLTTETWTYKKKLG